MIEVFSNVFNLLSVWFANRNNYNTWWTGIVGSILLGIIFFGAKLYADVTLMVFYVVTGAIGWLAWRYGGKNRTELPVTKTTKTQWIWVVALSVLTVLGYGSLLHHYTNAAAPFVDSAILALSVAATYLMMGRKVESWWLWIIADVIAFPLYWYKGIVLTAILYLVYLVNAWYGLKNWQRLEKEGK